ncbi:MAG: DEAD/DEAH box helicase [Lachnospiraceae bacterium]|nr:DEAD/DEAH box helicase [Lachnospiraceae bacterium]
MAINKDILNALYEGMETAYINRAVPSDLAFRPQFISNDYHEGKKVLASIEDELHSCDCFKISVAFITMGGIAPLLQTLYELEDKGIPGEILTTNYLSFSEPKALRFLYERKNITIKMFDVDSSGEGFHTKGYIFKKDEIYRFIIGSSNITKTALTSNKEWNTRVVSTQEGELAKQILEEYQRLWDSPYSMKYEDFIEQYQTQYEIIKHQRAAAREENPISFQKYQLKPNSMQVGFITNLKKIVDLGEKRALLISATGTGKTYASAFAMRELGFKRVLFLAHRNQLVRQAKRSFERVFNNTVSTGIVGAGILEYDADFVFATRDTMWREEHLHHYSPDNFDCIILDEAHHSAADTYQRIMNYFRPKFWLGMTATPDKKGDNVEGQNIYELFHYQIAYEIRLQQAMEENLLCPFHYFGISDLSLIGDTKNKGRKLTKENFRLLVSDERVKHIVKNACYYGYSGDRVKGLVFCSNIKEAKELSERFNQTINPNTGKLFRTKELDGNTPDKERENAFERLAMDEAEASEERQPLDYIFSVEILNEGVDIIEVNQVIMLRPTESPIVFIQQLGRGLRKAEGKEYVIILDFIGNYEKNFLIPVALSGDRTYNPDTIRKYVISGNSIIPGASTVHFDEVAREKIFQSIDKIRGMKSIIRDSYVSLKNRLGRVPYLMDFYENGEIDPLVIIREYKTYQDFLLAVEKNNYQNRINTQEKLTLEYLSKTVLSGVRPYELEILQRLFTMDQISLSYLAEELQHTYYSSFNQDSLEDAIRVLEGRFVRDKKEYQNYKDIKILERHDNAFVRRMQSYKERLAHTEFCQQVQDIISVGMARYHDKYRKEQKVGGPFILYEKYTRRDISLLMNCGKDLSSTMFGMKRIGDDVFVFVTYHKMEAESADKLYAEGKPDYADAFKDSMTFNWDSQIGKGPNSSYMQDVIGAKRKHLLVKKSDAEESFYYLGTFDIIEVKGDKKKDNKGRDKSISKVIIRMHHAVREDLLKYFESVLEEAV